MKNWLLLLFPSLVFWVPVTHAERDARPNIVMIMADDIGYECLSCNGSSMYETPNLDKLAASGMRFEHAHSQPICTPSRVQIMTGIYNNRNYIRFGLLDPRAVTFGNVMREAGYDTCIAGKWQLEGGMPGPIHFGFDRYCLWQLTRRPSRYPNPGLEIDGREKDFKQGQFGPDIVSDYICSYLEEKGDNQKPFLVYYPMILPHWPFVPTPDSEDWDPNMWKNAKNEPGGYKDQKYWDGMVRYTDKMVGKIVGKLDELGLRESTLVIFTGDNGTYAGIRSEFDGREYMGGKGSTKDNGTHVAFIASWPGTIESGQVRQDLVDFTDVFPTMAELGKAKKPDDLDGQSLVPVFTGKGSRKKDTIYCWYHRDGIRDQASQHTRNARYKLYDNGKFYDVKTDLLEKNDLAKDGIPPELTDIYNQLKSALEKHQADTRKADPIQEKKRIAANTKKRKSKKKK